MLGHEEVPVTPAKTSAPPQLPRQTVARQPQGCARTWVLLPRREDTVVCTAQARLLVQTSLQVPPPSCRDSRVSAHRSPSAARAAPFASLLCSSPASLPIPGSGLQPRPLSPGRGRVPAAPAGTERLNPIPLPFSCSPPSLRACLSPLPRSADQEEERREDGKDGESTGAGSVGEHGRAGLASPRSLRERGWQLRQHGEL